MHQVYLIQNEEGMCMYTDKHGQPAFGVNKKNNEKKALREFLGLAQGLVADQKINEMEATTLDAWLRDNEVWLKADPDYVDLLDITTDILADSILELDELLDLKECLYTVCEYRDDGMFSCADEAITRLIGIARGITADTVLTNDEIYHLNEWIGQCGEWRNHWPVNLVANKIDEILADGVITDDERKHLYDVLIDLIGGHLTECGEASGTSTRLAFDDVECIEFDNKLFCFTGKFISGTRKECEKLTEEKGGNTHARITKKVDYLIIGSLSSRDWANSTFGRKVEQVIQLKEDGSNISIINEEHWVKYVN